LGGWQEYSSGFLWVDVTCFAAETLIHTSQGAQPVNMIKVGDQIKTPSGFTPVVWVGRRYITSQGLSQNPKLRPIRIMAGVLGNGLPTRDLLVSRQHRMLVSSKIAERMFGAREVLISAIKLTELPGIFVDEDVTSVEYFHLLLDHHEVVFAEGAPSESLFTGTEALNAMSPEAREEIMAIFPEISSLDYTPQAAYPIPLNKHQKELVARHVKNNKKVL
jgi:hypothetical protein